MMFIPFGEAMSLFFRDIVGGIIGFPFWWYGKGLKSVGAKLWRGHASYRASMGVGIWIRNIFVPMYGSTDIGGRIVSFFMRCVMIVLRSFAVIAASVIFILLFIAYLILPAAALLMLVYNAFGSFLTYVG